MSRPPLRASLLRRREVLGLLPASMLAGLGISSLARASVNATDRKFLFVFAQGGWDPTWVFAPEFDNASVDMPMDDSIQVELGGLTWVSGSNRPSVDDFFSTYGSRTCIVNGLEIRSIAHERCRHILFTGGADAEVNDFPTRLAAASQVHLPLGNVVLSGPSFADSTASTVVRVGTNGQLSYLIDGSCMVGTSPRLYLPYRDAENLEDAFVRARAQKAAAAAAANASQAGASARIKSAYAASLSDIPTVAEMADLLHVGADDPMGQLRSAVSLLAAGVSRCVTIADLGKDLVTWDHHAEISRQGTCYELLFRNLGALMELLETTTGTSGGALADEVTVVVCSEMGRYPQMNASLGKDHWTTTSMMLLGAGITGGRVIGGYDANMGGVPVIPSTGESDPDGTHGGVVLQPAHLGATLLALADLDPTEAFGADVEPLTGLFDR